MKKIFKIIEYCGKTIKYKLMKELHKKKNKIDKRLLNARIEKWKDIIKQGNFCEKCGSDFRVLNKKRKLKNKHPHHIISEWSVRYKYPELIDDLKNGILLCSHCHKMAGDSAHSSGFEFTFWLMNNRRERYDYLMNKLKLEGIIVLNR